MILSVANIRKTKNYLKKNGLKDTLWASAERIYEKKKYKYDYVEPSEEELEKQRSTRLENAPKLSLIVPAYETKPVFMEDLILSVAEQSYENYELIIADASSSDKVEKVVTELQKEFDHIQYHRLSGNHGISENTQEALAFASGDYIGLLDHDDLLTKDALFETAKAIADARSQNISPTLVYSDEDKTNSFLEYYYEPNRKQNLNPDMLLTNNYICHLSFYREDVIKMLGFRKKYDGAQDYDLVLRTVLFTKEKAAKEMKLQSRDNGENAEDKIAQSRDNGENAEDKIAQSRDNGGTAEDKKSHSIVGISTNSEQDTGWKKQIIHVPKVLYHWRCHEASTAENPAAKMYAYEAGKRAVEDFLKQSGIKATVSHLKHLGFYRVDYGKNIFEERKEIGVVGGPVYEKHGKPFECITGGAMNAKGQILYEGLPKEFSGIMHRAALQQDVDAVDVRNILVRENLIPLFEKMVGIPYSKRSELSQKKYSVKELEEIRKKSLLFCNKVRGMNIGILYDPQQM